MSDFKEGYRWLHGQFLPWTDENLATENFVSADKTGYLFQ